MVETKYSEEQQYYLDLLAKFSSRSRAIKAIDPQNETSVKTRYIKSNLSSFHIDQQVKFNNVQTAYQKSLIHSLLVGGATATSVALYYIMTKPVTSNLYFELIKSCFVGIGGTYGFYRYKTYQYNNEINRIYVQGLQRQFTVKDS